MMITLIVITALLSGASVLVTMQLQSTRTTDLTRNGVASLFCAEAGLAAARPVIAGNYPQWNPTLILDPTGSTQPAWLSSAAFSHDLDGDGVDDFTVSIRDNDDEIAPTANNPQNDIDQQVFVIATCIKYPDMPKRVEELAKFNPGGQSTIVGIGGVDGNGNSN